MVFWLGLLRLGLLIASTVAFSWAAWGRFHYDLDRIEASMRSTSARTAWGAGFAAAAMAIEAVLFLLPSN
jgi:hypothetical protein